MPGTKKNIDYSFDRIQKYLNNQMTGNERNAFEKDMQKDPFLADAVEGLNNVSQHIAEKDISGINEKLTGSTLRYNRRLLYSIAASVAVLAVISTIFITVFLNETAKIPDSTSITRTEPPASPEIDTVTPGMKMPLKQEFTKPVSIPSVTEKKVITEKIIPSPKEQEIFEYEAYDTAIDTEENFVLESLIDQSDEDYVEETETFEKKKEEFPEIDTENLNLIHVKESSRKMQKSIAGAPAGISPISEPFKLTGNVISAEDKTPVPGAKVIIAEIQKGVLTDTSGKFEIPVPESLKELTLVVDFIGMEKQELKVPPKGEVMVELQPSVTASEEIVSIGYGVQEKDYVTGSVTTITGDELLNRTSYQSATPVTGFAEFYSYIENNIVFPENTGITKAVVVLNFIIETNGRIRDITVVKSPSDVFSSEAIRLLNEGPRWTPAMSGERLIESGVRVRIVFK